MNLPYLAYNCIGTALFASLFWPFYLYSRITGRYRDGLCQRLGLYPKGHYQNLSGSRRIWIHAVSVGEVRVATSIIRALLDLIPDCTIILSTTTEAGQLFAQSQIRLQKLTSNTVLTYAPIDFIISTRKALSALKPDMLVVLETEIWPNWFMQARKMGIKIALINGRISVRSIKGYLKLVPIIKDTLSCVDAFSMIHEADARRIMTMGALPDRVEVNGNAKFDMLLKQADPSLKQKMEALYRLQGDETVFVAGSTRRGEEEAILDVYEEMAASFPKSVLIMAPRHIKRANHIADLVKRRGLSCQFRTELNQTDGVRIAPVVIIDTIGELQATYSIATLVFCGGSLVPKGGQNAFEAAVWGKPVLYGPSMEDFLDIKVALEKTGGSVLVQNRTELAKQVMYLLNHPEKAREMGKSARRTVTRHKGAADKHAAVVHRLLNRE